MAISYNFPSIHSGNTFSRRTWSTDLNLTGASICFQFKVRHRDKVELEVPVVIDNASDFSFGGFAINLKEGFYEYDMVFTLTDGSVTTYFTGGITVLKNISKCL